MKRNELIRMAMYDPLQTADVIQSLQTATLTGLQYIESLTTEQVPPGTAAELQNVRLLMRAALTNAHEHLY